MKMSEKENKTTNKGTSEPDRSNWLKLQWRKAADHRNGTDLAPLVLGIIAIILLNLVMIAWS